MSHPRTSLPSTDEQSHDPTQPSRSASGATVSAPQMQTSGTPPLMYPRSRTGYSLQTGIPLSDPPTEASN
ncbi:hypothetical protein NliqN6_0123 [Naganishia liquefaciens]|uniref:Uncharacterized protein n=1 Tax=Naganishia liquefaciens TaxID=104408 RepID=A0A8H3TN22_9TREE|nr:hypothetical protein NliqN6_0123 [Naganishia liquefaciens]